MTEFDSPPESDAWDFIRIISKEYGFKMTHHKRIAGFELDYALEKGPIRIAVEIDGKTYHNPVSDSTRDTILLREGWRTHRIPALAVMYDRRGSAIHFNNFLKSVKPLTYTEMMKGGFTPQKLERIDPWD